MMITEQQRIQMLVATANAVAAGIGTATAETHLNEALAIAETLTVETLLCVQFTVSAEPQKLLDAQARLALLDPLGLDAELEHALQCRAAPVLWDVTTGPIYKAERELAEQALADLRRE